MTADFNDKDLRQVIKCDAELKCTATPQLSKAVADELNDDDKDIKELLEDSEESQSAAEPDNI